ncbi:MAG TPA: hotdog fold thioesterase [Steroidobacteraceae bacterium]|nr:hotdog fold thioesterase [Steroidobacteraceae bacterium]
MAIWFRPYTIADIVPLRRKTMVEHIGIEITEIGEDYIRGTMPVDERTRQTMGLLHGGASVALAETLGSIGGALVIDPVKQSCVGLEINANHLRAARAGLVTGTARPINLGRSVHVWQTEIVDETGKPVCVSRLTLYILDRSLKAAANPGTG